MVVIPNKRDSNVCCYQNKSECTEELKTNMNWNQPAHEYYYLFFFLKFEWTDDRDVNNFGKKTK